MNRAVKVYASLLSFELFVRGVDYVTGDSFPNGFSEDTLSMPIVWGVASLAASLIVVFGIVRSSAPVVQTGSIAAFAIYVMFAIQIFQVRMLPFPWPPEDTRIVASHLTYAGLWLTAAVTIWWREYITKRERQELDRKVWGEG